LLKRYPGDTGMDERTLSWQGIIARFGGAMALVYATFNPTGYSYYHWTIEPFVLVPQNFPSGLNPVKALVGLLLLAGWVVFLQATRRSLGLVGTILTAGIFACLIWLLIYWNVLSPHSTGAITHLALVGIAVVLTLGMAWSHITRRLSGQVDTDEVH
jgi:hypothetical protein